MKSEAPNEIRIPAITLCFDAERLFGAASLMLIVRRGMLFT
jgi:hypothetical protein